ncbi:MAG: hypothetical protein QOJ57_2988 [Thermoleophilaceae bacterium]|nr:hypothetical protein [Thermoleophilaceae bacterium]
MEAHQETLRLPPEVVAPHKSESRPRRTALAAGRMLGAVEMNAALLVPGVLTVVLSFNSGSFFPGSTALAAVELAVVAALVTLAARRPLEGVGPLVLIAAAGIAMLAGWTLLSADWSHSAARAELSYDRVLLYGLAFLGFGSIARTEGRMRVLVYGVAAGIVAVCVCALITRTLPHVWQAPAGEQPDRLSYPITYWNSLGMLAGVGILLCGHFACSIRDSWIVRVLGAAAIPLLTATLYYTFSRGATWSTAIGVLVYLAAARPRGIVAAAIAVIPTTLVALFTINPATALTANPASAEAISKGRHVAIVLLACALAAGLLRLLAIPVDRRLQRIEVGRRARRGMALGTFLLLVAGVVAALTVGNVSSQIDSKLGHIGDKNFTQGAGGSTRFLDTTNNGRIEQWQLALDDYKSHQFHGGGAGTFETVWAQKRDRSAIVVNAHSLYLETLNELGWPGLAMLVLALGGILVGLAARARGPERGIYAALLAASVAYLLHAAVDWDWQMPAVSLWFFAAGGLALAVRRDGDEKPMRRRWLRIPVAVGFALLALLPAHVLVSESHIKVAKAAYVAGDCRHATASAEQAIAAAPNRPDPRQLIAACAVRDGRPDVAVRQLNTAIALDPRNWVLWYDLAVARAAGGQNPRPAAQRALALNRLEPFTQKAAGPLSKGGKRDWKRAAANSTVLVP